VPRSHVTLNILIDSDSLVFIEAELISEHVRYGSRWVLQGSVDEVDIVYSIQ